MSFYPVDLGILRREMARLARLCEFTLMTITKQR